MTPEHMNDGFYNGLNHLYLRSLNEPAEGNRTAIKSWSMFGLRIAHDCQAHGFPIVTAKFTPMRLIAEELFWFLRGSTDVRELQARKCFIWDEWVRADGSLGPIYGKQWRDFGGVDQIARAYGLLARDLSTRRACVSAWNPPELDEMSLEPCHSFWQLAHVQGRLNLQVHQRSGDMFLGVPFNISSYALLLHIFARALGLQVGQVILNIGNAHLYENHRDQARALILNHMAEIRQRPRLALGGDAEFWRAVLEAPLSCARSAGAELVELLDHKQGPKIEGEVAV